MHVIVNVAISFFTRDLLSQTDGVTNILKTLGPVNKLTYSYNTLAGNVTTARKLTVYFNGLCDLTTANNKGVNCLPYLWSTAQG